MNELHTVQFVGRNRQKLARGADEESLDIFQLETPTGPVPMRDPGTHLEYRESAQCQIFDVEGAHALSAFEDLSEKLLVLVAQGLQLDAVVSGQPAHLVLGDAGSQLVDGGNADV